MVLFAALRSTRRDRDHNGKSTIFWRKIKANGIDRRAKFHAINRAADLRGEAERGIANLQRLDGSAKSCAAIREAPEQRALRNEISCGKSCAVKLKRKILRHVS